MVKTKTSLVVSLALGLALGAAFVGCSKKEEPAPKAAAPATAAQVAEVKTLVEDTKRYAESLKAQPAGDRASADQLSKLPGLLEQLLRHMEERAQASQQGGDVAKTEAQVAEDLKQIQEVQSALPAPAAEQPGTPAPAGQEKPLLDRVSENLVKITQIAQQGKELVAVVRPPKPPRKAAGSGDVGSSEGTAPADGTRSSDQAEPTAAISASAPATSEPTTDASNSPAPASPAPIASQPPMSSPAPMRTAQATAPPEPVTTGYASVHMAARPRNGARLQLKINGLLAGAYDQNVDVTLDPLLKAGVVNTITFTANRPGTAVNLSVKGSGNSSWVEILKFVSTAEKLEDSFQVPFLGK